MKKILINAISNSEIDTLLQEYEAYDSYESESMRKAPPGKAVKAIDEMMIGYKRIGGNYYKHSKPYLPHTDHRKDWGNSINVVVPLYSSDPNAHLVIFDQKYHDDSVTWCLHKGLIDFKVNTGVKGRPADYDVEGLTNKDIDNDLYHFLTWAPKDQWFGLTGEAMEFKPGNMLIFDNKYIHSTGNLNGTKIGLSLRYV